MSDQKSTHPSRDPRRGHRLGRALLGVPVVAALRGIGSRSAAPAHEAGLPTPVPGTLEYIPGPTGRVAVYSTGAARPARPLLLLHSVNAAASAYEVRPLFESCGATRPVYAIDLPGYGLSDRPARLYTPRDMLSAVLGAAELIRARHGGQPVDALAVSLSSEFVARAALEHPDLFHTLALVSPTGFGRDVRDGPPESTRGRPRFYRIATAALWRRGFFAVLTSRPSLRYFLEKTFGHKGVPRDLIDYDYLTTHQPGAEYAPLSFISGYLFSDDITRVYDRLRLPVWFVHGTRGDFVRYDGQDRVAGRPNWTVETMNTGALPYFEDPDGFLARYDAFLAKAEPAGT